MKVHFETGKPVTFRYFHNKEKSPNFGSQYGQDIEPAGRYVIHDETEDDYLLKKFPDRYDAGSITFKNPLVIDIKEPLDHKKILFNKYKKKGAALSRAIVKDGYDGIVSRYPDGSTGEIIDLHKFTTSEGNMTKAKKLLSMLEEADPIANLVKEFVTTLLWSETDDSDPERGGNPLDDNYSYTDMSKKALDKITKDVKAFLKKASDLIENDTDEYQGNFKQAMHDFCLTRNGHGSGFWDGGWSNGQELTKIAKSFGELNAYVGDDGKIYTT